MQPDVNNHILRYAIPLLFYCILVQYEAIDQYDKLCETSCQQGLNRRSKIGIKWDEISSRMGDYQFRRMFRMNGEWFTLLYFTIIGAIREIQFKLKHYIDAFLSGTYLYDTNVLSTGGYISCEVKLAITIRLLDGGDVLDLVVMFDIYPSYLQKIMKEVLMYLTSYLILVISIWWSVWIILKKWIM